jgi:predicted nucleic acid-binding protein
MSDLFVDTSGWGNLVDANQPFHALTTRLYRAARSQPRKIITTNYILGELVALLSSPLRIPRPKIIALIQGIRTSTSVEIIHIDALTDAQAWDLLANRQDKDWSLEYIAFGWEQRLCSNPLQPKFQPISNQNHPINTQKPATLT